MIGKFAQVTEAALQELLNDPDSVVAVFSDGREAFSVTPQQREQMEQRAAKLMPHVAAALDPKIRAALDQRLAAMGIQRPGVTSAAGIDPAAMMKLLEQRGFLGGRPSAPPGRGSTLSLEKAWHGVHYLLCGEVDEGATIESQAVAGGVEFGDDLGYGSARYHRPARVVEIAAALGREGLESEMSARFDPPRMKALSIYPGGWDQKGELDWLFDSFHRLRDFYREAAAGNFAVVLAIE